RVDYRDDSDWRGSRQSEQTKPQSPQIFIITSAAQQLYDAWRFVLTLPGGLSRRPTGPSGGRSSRLSVTTFEALQAQNRRVRKALARGVTSRPNTTRKGTLALRTKAGVQPAQQAHAGRQATLRGAAALGQAVAGALR